MRAYLDHASTSPLHPRAREAMLGWLSAADPGRIHTEGRMARAALEDARASVASLFGTRPRQVIFTSGATEAINAATFGALTAAAGGAGGRAGEAGPSSGGAGGAIALAEVEHSAVREASGLWASELVTVGVDRSGRLVSEELESVLSSRPDVRLVQCQLANHEVGTLQPVAEVASLCRSAGVLLHVDAAAAAGHVPIDFDGLGADLLSVSAHKMGGPAGVGALLVRRGLRVPPLIVGGSQERARRGGFENVAGAVGFGALASYLAGATDAAGVPGAAHGGEASEPGGRSGPTRMGELARRAAALTERLRVAVSAVDGVTVYGPADAELRLPHLLCVGIDGIEAEGVLVGLDRAGVAAHSGSACSSEALEPSPVLLAMGVDGDRSLRLSVGWSTTDEEIELAAGAFPRVVEGLRRLAGG